MTLSYTFAVMVDITESHKAVAVVTKAEAADALRVSIRTIDRYISAGTLASVRISPRATRISQASVNGLLAARATEALAEERAS